MAMKHDKDEKQTREWPARAADLQQEPAIPDDVEFPPDAEKPDKAIPKENASAEKVPANDDVTTSKADIKEAGPEAIFEEDAEPPAKTAAAKPDKSEKRPAAKKSAETRKG